MTAHDTAQQLIARITPILNELGVDSFVMAAYATDGEGKTYRLVVGHSGSDANPAYADGLKPMAIMAAKWHQGQL